MAVYDENGFDQNGRHRNGTFYDDNGWDAWGFDDYGRHYNGTFYDDRGYDAEGFDRRGRHYATGTFVDENGYDACGRHFKFEQRRQEAWERHQQGHGSKANWAFWTYGMDEDGNWIGNPREIAMVITRGTRTQIRNTIRHVDLEQVQLAMDLFRGRGSKAGILVDEMKLIARKRHDPTWSTAADIIGVLLVPNYSPKRRRRPLRGALGRIAKAAKVLRRAKRSRPRRTGPVRVRAYRRRRKDGTYANVRSHSRRRSA